MKKTLIITAACAGLLLLTQCAKKMAPTKAPGQPAAAVTPAPPEKPSVAEEIASVKARFTPDQMAQGKSIFDNKCGSCHEYREPAEFNVPSWDKVLPDMCHKAKLTAEESAVLHAWIITNAKEG